MSSHLCLFCIFVLIWQPTLCFFNVCNNTKNKILSNEECSDLYFESNEKTNNLGRINLELEQNSLKVTPAAQTWTDSYIKVSVRNNPTKGVCSKLQNVDSLNFFCFTFTPDMENQTALIEYKIEKLPEISYRNIVFTVLNWSEMPLFVSIDQTDLSRLVLKTQKLSTYINVSYYKVEAYREKSGNTNLLDTRHFASKDEVYLELFTYHEIGQYYFVIWVMGDHCKWNVCLKIVTPEVPIERRGTRVIIGIVGASFILPFILFVFHILTKKYPVDETVGKSEERLVVAYKSSSKKHNEVVLTLAALLESMGKNVVVDVIDLSKSTKKFPQKFCVDSLIIANRIVYVAPPKNDLNQILINKSLSEKDICAVMFEHCTDKLPHFIDTNKTFKLFEDFDKLTEALNISEHRNEDLYDDLVRKTEEAKFETDHLPAENLPQIIITESEPQEHDSLIAEKVIL